MLSDVRCDSCGIRFTVGWSEEGSFDPGYGGASHLVCTACGTQHRIDLGLRDRGPALRRRFDLTIEAIDDSRFAEAMRILRSRFDMLDEEAADALRSLPLPIARNVNEDLARELESIFSQVTELRVTEVASEDVPPSVSPRQDRLLSGIRPRFDDDEVFEAVEPDAPRGEPNGEIDLARQTCSHCGATGTLLANPFALRDTCPGCGHDALVSTPRHDGRD